MRDGNLERRKKTSAGENRTGPRGKDFLRAIVTERLEKKRSGTRQEAV